jgi:hypothetical protein
MRDRIGRVAIVLLAAVLAAGVASAAGVSRFRSQGVAKLLLDTPTFSTSGEYTGELGGDIVLDGAMYHLSPNAVIYQVDQGVIPMGSDLDHQLVFMTGRIQGTSRLVDAVVVQPADEVRTIGSPTITELPETAPR